MKKTEHSLTWKGVSESERAGRQEMQGCDTQWHSPPERPARQQQLSVSFSCAKTWRFSSVKKKKSFPTPMGAYHFKNKPNATSFMPAVASMSGRLHSEFVRLLSLQAHRETDRFFAASGVQLEHSTSGLFHFRRAAVSAQLKSRVGNILAKAAALRVDLNLDGAPITSRTHTHPSHSRTSCLLTLLVYAVICWIACFWVPCVYPPLRCVRDFVENPCDILCIYYHHLWS